MENKKINVIVADPVFLDKENKRLNAWLYQYNNWREILLRFANKRGKTSDEINYKMKKKRIFICNW
jgi:hypothetical protein